MEAHQGIHRRAGRRPPPTPIKIPGPDRATATVAHDGRVFAVEGEKYKGGQPKTLVDINFFPARIIMSNE
jgi:hypothetical protein